MTDTPLQSIQKLQTDTTILDGFLQNDANTEVDFSPAQDGSNMKPSLAMVLAGLSAVAPTQTANFAPDASATLWPIDATAGNIVVTVPVGSGFSNQKWKFVRIDASGHTVTIEMSSADTLNGASSQGLAGQWSTVEIHNQRGSAAWYVSS